MFGFSPWTGKTMILWRAGTSRIDFFSFLFRSGFFVRFHTRIMGENSMNIQKSSTLVLTGEDLHILNPHFQKILDTRDKPGLIRLARKQIDGGATALDINPGPAKAMAGRLIWAMEIIQQNWTIPLFLPAGEHLEAALQCHIGQATINAVTADPVKLETYMSLAKTYDANLVVLLTRPGLWTTGSQQQLQMALDVLEQADLVDLPFENIYLDPVFSVRTDPLTWNLSGGMPDLDRALELISLIGELSNQKAKTILALSNGTMGLAAAKRSTSHCRMLPLLVDAGLRAVILNCRDKALMTIARTLNNGGGIHKKAA